MLSLFKHLFPSRYESREMLDYYLEAQYGPYLAEGPTNEFESFYQDVLSFARPYITEGTRTLDIGCATGRQVFEYAKLGAVSTGTDLSQRFIDACNAIKNGEQKEVRYYLPADGSTSFLKDDISRTKLPEASFEFISCLNLIDRVPDPQLVLAAIEKLLVRGGVALLTDPYDWWLSPAPKRLHTDSMKSWFDENVWDIIEETLIPFRVPVSRNRIREYRCHLLIVRKK